MTNALEDFEIIPGLKLRDVVTVLDGQNALALLTNRLNAASLAEAEARDGAAEYKFLGAVAWQTIKQEHHAAKIAYGFLRDKIRSLNELERQQRVQAAALEIEERRNKKREYREAFFNWDRRILCIVKELNPALLEEASSLAQETWPEDFKATLVA